MKKLAYTWIAGGMNFLIICTECVQGFLIGMLIFVRQSAVWSQVYMDERLWIMLDELLMLCTEGVQDEDDGGKNQSDIKQYDQYRV